MNKMYHRDNYEQRAGIGCVYVGAPYQQGAGIASSLGGVFRYVSTLLKGVPKQSVKKLCKQALTLCPT